MKKLDQRVTRKKEIWSIYSELLNSIPEINLFNHDLNHTAIWFYDVLAEDERL